MATIYPPRQLRNGQTSYTVQVLTPKGFRTATWRRPLGMKENDAKRKIDLFAAQFETEILNRIADEQQEVRTRNDRITFGEFAEMWLKDSLQNHAKTSYLRNEKIVGDLKKFLDTTPLKQLEPLDCKKVVDYLNQKVTVTAKAVMKPSLAKIWKNTNIDRLCREHDFSTATVFYARRGNTISWEYAERISNALGINVNEHFTKTVKEERYSKSTKLIYRRTIFAILNHAIECKVIHENPAKNMFKVEKLSGEIKEKEILTLDETRQLQNAIVIENDKRKKAVVAALLYLGIRKGELCALQWSDIDFSRQSVMIQRSSTYTGARFKVVTKAPKTATSKRKLPIPGTLLEILAEYKEWQDEERQRLADIWQGEDWVFTTAAGGQIHPRTISWWLHLVLSRNGIRPVGCHSLRHTYITTLLRQKISPKVVSKLAGHSNPNVTLSIYAHVLEEDNEEVAKVIDNLFSQRKPQSNSTNNLYLIQKAVSL